MRSAAVPRATRVSPGSDPPRARGAPAWLRLTAAGAVAAAVAGLPPAAPAAPRGDQRLSNERTLTRWANVADAATIHARPDPASRRVSRLRWRTEDGFPEVYLLLRRHWDGQGREWIQLRIPMRPNGRVGWVPANALGPLHSSRSLLVIDRGRLRISLYRDGRRVWSAPVGIGSPGTPTPSGHFWIRERVQDPRHAVALCPLRLRPVRLLVADRLARRRRRGHPRGLAPARTDPRATVARVRSPATRRRRLARPPRRDGHAGAHHLTGTRPATRSTLPWTLRMARKAPRDILLDKCCP